MITIQLHQLLFKAYHGIHEEERILGNDYMVDCSVDFFENDKVVTHINDTIDYTEIYQLIKKRMKIATPLLETVIMEIGIAIQERFEMIKSIHISIKKLHPPIEGIQGSVGVTWQKQF